MHVPNYTMDIHIPLTLVNIPILIDLIDPYSYIMDIIIEMLEDGHV